MTHSLSVSLPSLSVSRPLSPSLSLSLSLSPLLSLPLRTNSPTMTVSPQVSPSLPLSLTLDQLHLRYHSDYGSKRERREKASLLAPLTDAKAHAPFFANIRSFGTRGAGAAGAGGDGLRSRRLPELSLRACAAAWRILHWTSLRRPVPGR
jgi:hypothetical protein